MVFPITTPVLLPLGLRSNHKFWISFENCIGRPYVPACNPLYSGSNGYIIKNPHKDYTYFIPMNPQKRSGNPGSFSSTNMGIIGFATNGVPIFNPYDSSCCDAGLYELTALDMCYAHPNGTRIGTSFSKLFLACQGSIMSQIWFQNWFKRTVSLSCWI